MVTRSYSRLVWLVGLTVAVLAGGCGVSGPRKGIESVKSDAPVARMGRVLARGTLPGGGRFIVVLTSSVERRIAYYAEEPARYGASHNRQHGLVRGGAGDGVRLSAPLHAPLEINVYQSCVGPYPYALAFGMLHNAHNSVTAYANDKSVKFAKAELPSSLRSRGTLVYALLGPGQNRIITRTIAGEIVSSEVRRGISVDSSCGN